MGLCHCTDRRREPHKFRAANLNATDWEQDKEKTMFNEKRDSCTELRESRRSILQTYNNDVLRLETSNSVACSKYIATDEANNLKLLLPKEKLHLSMSGERNSISIDGTGQLLGLTSQLSGKVMKRDLSKAGDNLKPTGVKGEVEFPSSSNSHHSGTEYDNSEDFQLSLEIATSESSVRNTTEKELLELGLLGAHSTRKLRSQEKSLVEHNLNHSLQVQSSDCSLIRCVSPHFGEELPDERPKSNSARVST